MSLGTKANFQQLAQQMMQAQQPNNALMGQLGLSNSQLNQWMTAAQSSIESPPIPPGQVLYMVGCYDLILQGDWYRMRHLPAKSKILTPVADWKTLPSRNLIAATIRWHRSTLPRVNARDEYGMLLGVRYFKINEDFHLASPHIGTIWETSTLTASVWSDEDAVRGRYGIHAAWPTRGSRVIPAIDYKTSLGLVIGQVRGHGRTVLGTEGWRAEKVIIDTIYLPQALFSRWRVLKRLRTLYPDVTFLEEPWTLERSSKSAR